MKSVRIGREGSEVSSARKSKAALTRKEEKKSKERKKLQKLLKKKVKQTDIKITSSLYSITTTPMAYS